MSVMALHHNSPKHPELDGNGSAEYKRDLIDEKKYLYVTQLQQRAEFKALSGDGI